TTLASAATPSRSAPTATTTAAVTSGCTVGGAAGKRRHAAGSVDRIGRMMTPVRPTTAEQGMVFANFGASQPDEYRPLPAFTDGRRVLTEWEPTSEERARIAAG